MPLDRDQNYSGPHTYREFVFSPSEANAWLEERVPVASSERSLRNARQQLETRRQYQKLSAHPEFGSMVSLLRQYVDTVIFEPEATERDWWVVTSVPATGKRRGYRRLSCISIQWIEMMLFGESLIDGIWTVGGFINVPLSVGEEWAERASSRLCDSTRIRESFYKYSGMLARIEFDSLATFAELIADPELIDGSEALALGMMRVGKTPYARFHDFNLADDIFGRAGAGLDDLESMNQEVED